MEKLRYKIFWVIFTILSLFVLSILTIFNYQNYNTERNNIENSLMRIDDGKFKNNNDIPESSMVMPKNDDNMLPNENPIFMDVTAFTVLYNDNYEVTEVINHTPGTLSDEEIKTIASQILKDKSVSNNIKVANLYTNKYSYSYNGHNSLSIIDNSDVQTRLISFLKTSIIILALSEIVLAIVSVKLTNWIIVPVTTSFDKQKQFIADASHELKTPLAVIIANAEALQNEPTEAKWLENIKSESERMNSLITELLNLAKSENNAETKVYGQENLSKIIEKSALVFESLAYENGVNIHSEIEEDVIMNCNPGDIKELISILLDNAIKHSYKGSTIDVTLKKSKNNVILDVQNQGKEIPKEIQDKIFERFYKADESRNVDNKRFGLGLAIAKNIVEKYNGKISVTSENECTTFSVKIKNN